MFDTGIKYEVSAEQRDWGSTVEINRGMEYGLLKIGKHVLPEHRDEGLQSFVSWLEDEKRHRGCFSSNDGGQLMYNFLLPEPGCTDVGATLSTGSGGLNVLLWNGHLGGYEGIMRSIKPKPDVAILGAAGIGNKDGRPFDGSAAEFLEEEIKWLDNPERVIWCLHDEL
ncbi:hypothetical protein K469DRAFT_693043 [Neofusicoccum parvum]|nr:hypothetical protein K469DRAFT_693043 [Neofusicoccum parvum]